MATKKNAAPPAARRGRPPADKRKREEEEMDDSPFAQSEVEGEEPDAVEEPKRKGKSAGSSNGMARSTTASWFSEGFEAAEEEVERQKLQKEAGGKRTNQFTLRPGGRARVLILKNPNDKVFNARLHIGKKAGVSKKGQPYQYDVYATCCIPMYDRCPADKAGIKKDLFGHLTVIHISDWNAEKKIWVPAGYEKDGKFQGNQKKIVTMRPGSVTTMAMNKDTWGALGFCVCDVQRSEVTTSAKIGDNWQLKEKIDVRNKADLKKYGLENVKDFAPLDYMTLLAPMSPEAMAVWVDGLADAQPFDNEPEETVKY